MDITKANGYYINKLILPKQMEITETNSYYQSKCIIIKALQESRRNHVTEGTTKSDLLLYLSK